MKAKVICDFHDKVTGIPRGFGQVLEVSEERFEELKRLGKVVALPDPQSPVKELEFDVDKVFFTGQMIEEKFEIQNKKLKKDPIMPKKGRKPGK